MAPLTNIPSLSTTVAALTQFANATPITTIDATVTSTPPNVEQLLRQVQISGTVTAPPDQNGDVTLTTALGNFSFQLAQLPETIKQQIIQQLENAFQTQKPITAIIQPGAPPTQAVLLLPTTTAATQTPSQPLPQQVLPQQPITLSAGATLPAVVLPSNITLPNSSSSATQIPQSYSTLPPDVQTPAASQGASQIPQQPTTSSLPPQLLQPGKEIVMRVDAVALPSSPAPTPTANNQITGTVIGAGANGQLIVKTPEAVLYVRAAVDAPVGTNLLVTLEAPKAAAPALLPPVQDQTFASLQQMLSVLTDLDPQLAQQFTQMQIPQPNAQMAAPLLFFLSALKQGDAKNWLGENVADTLSKGGKIELLTRLMRDMNGATQTERDPLVGEWKSYPIPLQNQGQLQTLTLHVHADDRHKASKDDPQPETAKQVRFLIDVRMSKLGPIQLDGLVRPKKLDMIIRSETALPPGVPQDLRNGYLATMEALGYTGGLSFQSGRQHWLVPYKQSSQSLIT